MLHYYAANDLIIIGFHLMCWDDGWPRYVIEPKPREWSGAIRICRLTLLHAFAEIIIMQSCTPH